MGIASASSSTARPGGHSRSRSSCGRGSPPAGHSNGRSFAPLLHGQTPTDWRKDWYYEYYEYPGPHSVRPNRGVATERYKYIHYYGIWDIEQLSVDGRVRPAVLNDYDRRWRRAIFDAPDSMAFQRTDDSFAHYGAFIDSRNKTLALTEGRSRKWRADFTFERPAADQLILDGEMDGYKIRMQLQLVNFDTFRILNSGFRWVRPPDP